MTESWRTTLFRAAVAVVIVAALILLILTCIGFRPAQIIEMFSYPIRGGTGEVVEPVEPEPAQGEDQPEKEAPRGVKLRTSDGAVLVVYLIAMVGIGYAASRRIKGTRGFFVADGRLNYVLVGVSLLGTYLSALTVTALPGMSFGEHNWTYMVQLPFLIVTAVVITRLVLPRYRKAGVISVYEYLEQRIHVTARVIASISFVVFSIGRMGLLLYLPALALSTITNVSLPLSILVMGLFITIYTVLGGIEAVVWTDAIQVIIFIVGAFVTLGYIFSDLGVEQFLEIGMAHNKFQLIDPSLDITEIVTLWLILETIFQTIRIYGTQQDMTQRYMTTESTKKANRSVWISILAYIPLGFLFYFIGTALFAFYKAHPAVVLPEKPDQIYPYFMVNQLPPGVAGLVVAAIFAAAMSSIDSLMNSSSTVCIEDFFKRFRRVQQPDAVYLRKARQLTMLWGVLAVGTGFAYMGTMYAQIVWGKLMATATNGMLGLMALAFLPFRIHKWAAIIGFVVSCACLPPMMLLDVSYLIWPVVGNLACFLVALALNPLFSRNTREATADS